VYLTNIAAIVLTVIGIYFLIIKNKLFAIFLKVVAVARISVIALVISVYGGFVAAYTPSAPVIWINIFKLPYSITFMICAIFLVLEIINWKALGITVKNTDYS
jgi:hypothetical protein